MYEWQAAPLFFGMRKSKKPRSQFCASGEMQIKRFAAKLNRLDVVRRIAAAVSCKCKLTSGVMWVSGKYLSPNSCRSRHKTTADSTT